MPTKQQLPPSISPFAFEYKTPLTERIDETFTEYAWRWIDTAWSLMIIKQGIVPEKHLPKILPSMVKFWDTPEPPINGFASTEKYVIAEHGVEVGGTLAHGRTIPPYVHMFPIRRELMKLICMLHDLQESVLDTAETHLETVMPGYTHVRQAQPETLGHYLLSVYDPMERIMQQVEAGYHGVSLSELGCGALSGTSLPIDRDLVSDYLGMEGVIENSNDAVAYTDGYITLHAALANMVNLFSRVSLDMQYWSSEEYGFLHFPWFYQHPPQSKGGKGGSHSHFMPNKLDNSPYLENTRVAASMVHGALMEVISQSSRCPHADMVEMMQFEWPGVKAIEDTHRFLHVWIYALPGITVNKERMLEAARRGYSCASELQNRIVIEHDIDGRTAHQIVNELVATSRKAGVPASELKIDMLEDIAQEVLGHKLGMTEKKLLESMDPTHFVKVTNSRGGTAPDECRRMITERRKTLVADRIRHEKRVEKVEKGKAKMLSDLKKLAGKYAAV